MKIALLLLLVAPPHRITAALYGLGFFLFPLEATWTFLAWLLICRGLPKLPTPWALD